MKKMYKETERLLRETYLRDSDAGKFMTKKNKVMGDMGVLNKLKYILPNRCADNYLMIAGVTRLEDNSLEVTKKTKVNRCNKRTCSFCNREKVETNRTKIQEVLQKAQMDGNSIQMMTKTIPNTYISASA